MGVAWGGHDGREVWPGGWHLAHVARRQVVHYEGMRPGIVLENALGSHLFSGETGKGREWLKAHCTRDKCEWVGKFLSVDDEDDARDLVDAAVADGFDVME